jgi:hypothetical protein
MLRTSMQHARRGVLTSDHNDKTVESRRTGARND